MKILKFIHSRNICPVPTVHLAWYWCWYWGQRSCWDTPSPLQGTHSCRKWED